MPGNANFTTLIATTLQNFSNKIFNNVVTNVTLTRYMLGQGGIKLQTTVQGGRGFVHQLLYAKNSTFAARAHNATIPLNVTEGITASEWSIKVISGAVVLPTLHVAMNSGSKERLLDFANAKKLEAEVTFAEVINDQLWNTSVGANDADSIPRLISETPSADSDVGGISSVATAETWWRNYSHDTAVTAFNTSSAGLNAIDTSLRASTFGTMSPNLLITTKEISTLYMLGLTGNVRYSRLDVGSTGFDALAYGTGIPLVDDSDCPSGNLYGINTRTLLFQVLKQGDMQSTPFQFSEDQLAQSMLMYLFWNLTMGSRRDHFVIDSITG